MASDSRYAQRSSMAREFDHEKMPVFEKSVEVWGQLRPFFNNGAGLERLLAHQLYRAASSITLNIAEGAGEFSPADKARFYRIARRSAFECDAILTLLDTPPKRGSTIPQLRSSLRTIAAMLTGLIKAMRPKPSPQTPDQTPAQRM